MDEQLVNQIVRMVLERLNKQAPARDKAPEGLARPLAPRRDAPAAFPAPNAIKLAPNAAKRKVFVTADDLRRRIDADNKVVLLADERLTPNAQDYVDQHHIRVEQLTGTSAVQVESRTTEADLLPAVETFGVVLDGPDVKVANALAALGRDGMGLSRYDQTDCWIENSSAMLKCVVAGALGGGVILASAGASAMVLANKVRGVRAVQGLSAGGVSEAVDSFDANVLVIEHGGRSFHEIRTLIARFMDRRRRPRRATALLEAIRGLE